MVIFRGPTKRRKGLKHRKGVTKDILNTAKYDKGHDNSNFNPSLKSFVVLFMV